jgi:hypothetical protein
VAEKERLTNAERRAQAREERKRKEAEAAQKRSRGSLRTGLVTFAIVAVVGAVLLQAFLGGPDTLEDTILISSTEADEARLAAGCEVLVERQPLPDRTHFPSNALPPADSVYDGIRPTHSGPHAEGVHPVTTSTSSPVDEVVSTHNLEHGSVIVWFDPDAIGGSASDISGWAETLNANGFAPGRGGVGILTSPYEEPGLSSGKSVAFRAWGTAMDCEQWDQTVANAFVLDNFGTHGIGPERLAAPFPGEVLAYSDVDVEDTPSEEAPIDGATPEEDMPEVDPDEAPDDGDGS